MSGWKKTQKTFHPWSMLPEEKQLHFIFKDITHSEEKKYHTTNYIRFVAIPQETINDCGMDEGNEYIISIPEKTFSIAWNRQNLNLDEDEYCNVLIQFTKLSSRKMIIHHVEIVTT